MEITSIMVQRNQTIKQQFGKQTYTATNLKPRGINPTKGLLVTNSCWCHACSSSQMMKKRLLNLTASAPTHVHAATCTQGHQMIQLAPLGQWQHAEAKLRLADGAKRVVGNVSKWITLPPPRHKRSRNCVSGDQQRGDHIMRKGTKLDWRPGLVFYSCACDALNI